MSEFNPNSDPILKGLKEKQSRALAHALRMAEDHAEKEWTLEDRQEYDRCYAEIKQCREDIERREELLGWNEYNQMPANAAERNGIEVGTRLEQMGSGSVHALDKRAADFFSGRISDGGGRAREDSLWIPFERGIETDNNGFGYRLTTAEELRKDFEEIRTRNAELRTRDMSVAADASGGSLVGEAAQVAYDIAQKANNQIRNYAQLVVTSDGREFPYPGVNGLTNEGVIVDENTDVGNQEFATSGVDIKSHIFTSRGIPVSRKLNRDATASGIPFTQITMNQAMEWIARHENHSMTSAITTPSDANKKPQPLEAAVTHGPAEVTGANGINYTLMVNMLKSVNTAYRMNAAWYVNETVGAELLTILDGNNRPLFQADPTAAQFGSILGYPVRYMTYISDYATNKTFMYFGDMSKYLVREVAGVEVLEARERAIEKYQLLFYGFHEADGKWISAGGDPMARGARGAT